MRIFIPTYHFDYEGGDYMGVYPTFDAAKQVLLDKFGASSIVDLLTVDEWETDTGECINVTRWGRGFIQE